ncbi:MAG: HEAT repeat domain-containing protein [Cyanobacteria bacterium J06639_16]
MLAEIAQNTAQISPGFEVAKYRESLISSYGYLKLYILDSTDRTDAIKLWNIFIEQTVREALPPMRYELPLDLKRQLQDQGQLENDLSPEALEHYRHEYFQQPAQKVLAAIADSNHAVILGDPGAGKSTLLQYLALEWVEGKAEPLPLLIELRDYVLAQSANFLEFLDRGRGADWQFDQQQLHQHLLENPTLVMFDGLDEVFDRATQAAVIDDIIRFAQQYPHAKVLVTSRIIGYNPERFQHAGFRQFTIQSLDEDEIHEFIDRWYELAMGSDRDQERLKQRLKDAIANSKAIQNLADNPLLLTMMAILNRRQELPRDRADLYDQASRVLLYHWDVNHKRLNLPLDAIGRREKQEILRLVAYEMQAGEEGLKGNLISADQLTRILTNYLQDQGFGEPREKANALIWQLRERNFILCYRGADAYGFVHRTFLEYFCAVEIVYRFEKQHTLTFKQLHDDVFGQHWQDDTWHEVLRLVCSIVDDKFAGRLIEFLIFQKIDLSKESRKNRPSREGMLFLDEKAISHLFLAFECLLETKQTPLLLKSKLLEKLNSIAENSFHKTSANQATIVFDGKASKHLAKAITQLKEEKDAITWLQEQVEKHDISYFCGHGTFAKSKEIPLYGTFFEAFSASALRTICDEYGDDEKTFTWLREIIQKSGEYVIRGAAIQELAKGWHHVLLTLLLIKTCISNDSNEMVRRAALEELVCYWRDDPDTLRLLKKHAMSDTGYARSVAIESLSSYWEDDPESLPIIKRCIECDHIPSDFYARATAVRCLASVWKDDPETLNLIIERAQKDVHEFVRNNAITQLQRFPKSSSELFSVLKNIVIQDIFERRYSWENNPRQTALEVLLKYDPIHSSTLNLLDDRAANDPDPQLREWAQEKLTQLKIEGNSDV